MKKKDNIIYWIATGLLTAMMLMSVTMYLSDIETMGNNFEMLGYPSFLVIPLAIAKIAGLTAILSKANIFLKEWAYAGFFYNFILALTAHLAAGDGRFFGPLIALILLITSYIYDKKVFPDKQMGASN